MYTCILIIQDLKENFNMGDICHGIILFFLFGPIEAKKLILNMSIRGGGGKRVSSRTSLAILDPDEVFPQAH